MSSARESQKLKIVYDPDSDEIESCELEDGNTNEDKMAKLLLDCYGHVLFGCDAEAGEILAHKIKSLLKWSENWKKHINKVDKP